MIKFYDSKHNEVKLSFKLAMPYAERTQVKDYSVVAWAIGIWLVGSLLAYLFVYSTI